MRGPEFGGYPESQPAVTEFARQEMLAELAAARAEKASSAASREIAEDPSLQAILGKLIESGPELDIAMRAHLRMMAAMRLGGLIDAGLQANFDEEFHSIVAAEIGNELSELIEYEEGVADVPDLWDLAYQDLMRLEGGPEQS